MGEPLLGDSLPYVMGMACCLCGGMGGTEQEMCGALSGGALVIGAMWGRTSPDEDDQFALDLSARYRERFVGAFGGTQCAWLRENVVYHPHGLGACSALVKQATLILIEILEAASTAPGDTSSKESCS